MTIEIINGKISAVSQPKEHNGELQIGFLIQTTWYNIKGSKDQLDEVLKTLIKKGNVIEFEFDSLGKTVKNVKVIKEAEEEKENWQDDMVSFEDVLHTAHEKGIISINTELISIDFEKKTALFKAVVKGVLSKKVKMGTEEHIGEFTAYGDASAENIASATIKPHFIRMAETRAIARALRWYTDNAAVVDVETEKGDLPEKKKK